jgi:RNA-directed DNA polymerase
MHPRKSKDWRYHKYWGRLHLDRSDLWVSGDKQTGAYLLKFSWFPIERHVLAKGRASPDDPSLKDYWTKRQAAKAKYLTFSKQKLAKRQKGRCPECGESLFNEEELHVHHLRALSKGAKTSTATWRWFTYSATSTSMRRRNGPCETANNSTTRN